MSVTKVGGATTVGCDWPSGCPETLHAEGGPLWARASSKEIGWGRVNGAVRADGSTGPLDYCPAHSYRIDLPRPPARYSQLDRPQG